MSSKRRSSPRWILAAWILVICARAVAVPGPVESSLLFAELEAGFALPVAALVVSEMESDLVGIIVDGQEISMELVYREGDTHLLPADLLTRIGIKGRGEGDKLYLDTPGGEVEAPGDLFRSIGGRLYFSDVLLDEVLRIQWEFSAAKYAFNMTLPWWQQSAGGEEELFRSDPTDAVDVAPSSLGLTQVRVDHSQYWDKVGSYGQSNLLLRGRAFEGIWRGELIAREGRDVRAEDYYWLKDFDHVQALAGNQQVLINPLLPSIETTGAQALYSSEGVDFDPYHDQTRSQYIRRFGIPAKNIEGTAQPGAIAELRVDERPIARARVNLDGTYRFEQVRSNSLQFQTVRVHVLDQRSYVELEVQDFTRTPMDLLLEEGQTVAFGGAGAYGNPLDPVLGTNGAAAFGLVRYGLTERLTLEAGMQNAGDQFHQTAGLSASIGRHMAASASVGNRDGNLGHSVDFYGRGDRWNLNLRSQQYEEGFRVRDGVASSFHELRYEYLVNGRLSVGMHGRSRDTGSDQNEYLLPGMTWRFGERNILKVWPDFDGSYRVDVRTMHRQRDWLEFVADASGERAEYRYFRDQNHELFGRLSHRSFDGSTIAEAGSIWYPNRMDDRSLLSGSVLAGNNGVGFRFAWQTGVLPGLFSQLELRDEPVATEFVDPGVQVRWTLSVDLSISGGRPIPARNDFIQARLGSIAGRLTMADGASLASEGVDRVAILLDGRPQTAVLRGRHFFVRNVPPGVYEVSLGSEHLPLTLSPVKTTYRVKVVPAATSTVDFVVQREFGLAGQVTDAEGLGVGGALVEVRDEDGLMIQRARTDSYGYYRVAGLVPGTYQVLIEETQGESISREIEILDTYVFDANLTLAASADSDPQP